MNTLSWLFYLAGVSGSLGTALTAISFLTAILAFLVYLAVVIPNEHDKSDSWKEYGPKSLKALIITFFLSLFGLLLPSQETVYLIIASESAEMIVTSEQGQAMLTDIQEIVAHKLDEIMNPQQTSTRD